MAAEPRLDEAENRLHSKKRCGGLREAKNPRFLRRKIGRFFVTKMLSTPIFVHDFCIASSFREFSFTFSVS